MAAPVRFRLASLLTVLGVAAGPTLLACGGSDKPAVTPDAPASAQPGSADIAPAASVPAPAETAARPPEPPQPWPHGPAQTAAERATQLERLTKDPGPLKSNWVPPSKTERYGHAEGLIAAPVDAVRARLVDFAHYKDLAGPKFKTVRVVDKQGDTTDVYFQLPIMKGVVTINYVTRFAPAKPAQGGGEVVEGTFVKGNIKGMHLAFTVRPGPDETSSIMVCDLLLQLNVPAPQAAVDEELRDACGDAINAVRKTTAQAAR